MKLVLLIVVPIAVAIFVLAVANNWIWAIVSFIASIFLVNWMTAAPIECPPELLKKAIAIADFRNSLPLSIRSVTNVNGLYIQCGQMEDGSTEYAVGSDMNVPALIFRNLPEGVRVIKYVHGNWEEALDKLSSKVHGLRAAIMAEDKKDFLIWLQVGLNIVDINQFAELAGAEFEKLVSK